MKKPIQMWRHVVRNKYEYGLFLLDSTGILGVVSSFGNYAFAWSNFGDDDFRDFLIHLEADYLEGKLTFGMKKELDGRASVKSIRREILTLRRARSINKTKAREEWRLIEAVALDNEVEAHEWYEESRLCDDSYELFVYRRPIPTSFFPVIWLPFVEQLKEALRSEREAVQRETTKITESPSP